MNVGRYLIAAALSALLASPVVAQTTTPSTQMNRPSAPSPESRSGAAARTQPQGGLVDINSASAAELDKLPGVGTARAQAIIANRPYRGKDELAQRKIVPQNVYEQIKDKIIARQGSSSSGTSSGPASSSTTGTKSK
jgi:competence protein ComEA